MCVHNYTPTPTCMYIGLDMELPQMDIRVVNGWQGVYEVSKLRQGCIRAGEAAVQGEGRRVSALLSRDEAATWWQRVSSL